MQRFQLAAILAGVEARARPVHNPHGRGNGEERRRECAGNLIQNLLQSLG
ncbi:MAG TPA: hypothetical protein VNO13_08865 [Candidatus Udaeobacter sp.]|nr:hypothetical protein [Candidatus Udaeobacter sp.]